MSDIVTISELFYSPSSFCMVITYLLL